MDSDEVNSINDTTEATQVARCIRQAYYDLIADLDPPELYSMFQLEASGTSSQPTLMTVPTSINSVIWVEYDCKKLGDTQSRYQRIHYVPMDEFLNQMYALGTDATNINTYNISVNGENIAVNYYNDRAPTTYTCFGDDITIIFDAYDVTIDTTFLLKAKTICYGKNAASFALTDGTTPTLDEPYFARLLNEAKLLAFAELKSTDHAIANRNAKRSRDRSAAEKFRVRKESDFAQLANFGRTRGTFGSDRRFREK